MSIERDGRALSSETPYLRAIDLGAQIAGIYAAAVGTAHRIYDHVARARIFGPNHLLTRLISHTQFPRVAQRAGFWGMVSMVWSAYRAADRLIDGHYETSREKKEDILILAGAGLAILNIGFGLFRGSLARRMQASGLAFIEDQMRPMTWVQNGFVFANWFTDGWGLKTLWDANNDHWTYESVGQFSIQASLAFVFGCDRQSRHSIEHGVRRLFGWRRPMDQLGETIGNLIRTSNIQNLDRVRSNPYHIASLLLRGLELPPSHAYAPTRHYLALRKPGDLEAERAVEALLAAGVLSFDKRNGHLATLGPSLNTAEILERIGLDELFETIFRRARDRGVEVTRKDMQTAKEVVVSGLFQRFFATDCYGAATQAMCPEAPGKGAERVGWRIGSEWEIDPAHHPIDLAPEPLCYREPSQKRALGRGEHLAEMAADLEKAGWRVKLIEPQPVPLDETSMVYPTEILRFEHDGKRYLVHNLQATSGNLLYAWCNGEMIPGLRKGRTGPCSDDAVTVMGRIRENSRMVVRTIAEQLAAEKGSDGDLANTIEAALQRAIFEQDGRHYIGGNLKTPAGLENWSAYQTSEPGKEGRVWKVRFDTCQLVEIRGGPHTTRTPSPSDHLPDSFESFDEAYAHFKTATSKGSPITYVVESAEKHIRLQAEKDGCRITLNTGWEADQDMEFNFDHQRAGGLSDQFLEIVGKTLQRLGAEGTRRDNYVAYQSHTYLHNPGQQAGPIVKVMREVHRYQLMLEPGVPGHPIRATFRVRPERTAKAYARGEGLSEPPLRKRQGDALADLYGHALERRSTESEIEYLIRMNQWYNHNHARHGSIVNLENAIQSALEEAVKRNQGLRRGHPEKLSKERLDEALSEVRSKRKPAISTVELRWPDTPEAFDERGRLVVSPEGLLWEQKVHVGLSYAAQQTDLLTRGEKAKRLRAMANARLLQTYAESDLPRSFVHD